MKDILVIDDSEPILKLVQFALQNEYNIILADNAETALKLIDQKRPDLIISDVMLPGISGHELCTDLKNDIKTKDVPIIMISARAGSKARAVAYDLGVNHYLEKPFEINELKAMVKQCFRDNDHVAKEVLSFNNLHLLVDQQKIKINEKLTALTTSEFKILFTLISNPNTIFERSTLLEKVSPDNLEITERTIDNHISSLRKKIKNSDSTIETIYGRGYRLK